MLTREFSFGQKERLKGRKGEVLIGQPKRGPTAYHFSLLLGASGCFFAANTSLGLKTCCNCNIVG